MDKGKWAIFMAWAILSAGMLAFSSRFAFVNFVYPPEKEVHVSRSFEPSDFFTAGDGSTITVTVDVTNNEDSSLRGFYYSDQAPNGWEVDTASVSVDGVSILDYAYEQGSADDIYADFTPHRWALEVPREENVFSPTHPIPASGGTARVIYRIAVSGGSGSDYSADHNAWAGWLATSPTGTGIFGYQVVVETLKADFTAEPRSGVAPLTVTFTDTSIGDILTCTWDFGDGSTTQLPGTVVLPYTYTYGGHFTVSLTVQDAYTSSTAVKQDFITVTEVICTVYLPVVLRDQAP